MQKHFPCLQSQIDRVLVVEIGYHQEHGRPLTMKALLLLELGAPATVRRHLQKLIELRLINKRRANHDKRVVHLEVDPATRTRFAKFVKPLLRR